MGRGERRVRGEAGAAKCRGWEIADGVILCHHAGYKTPPHNTHLLFSIFY